MSFLGGNFSAISGQSLGARLQVAVTTALHMQLSGPEEGVITKGVSSLEESLKSLDSLECLGNGRILLYFPQSGGSLESLNSLESLENGLF